MTFVRMIPGPYGTRSQYAGAHATLQGPSIPGASIAGSPRSEHMQLPGAAQGPAGAEGIRLGFPSPELALS